MLFAMNFKKLTLTLFTRNITHLKKTNYRPKSKASESSLYDQIYEYIGCYLYTHKFDRKENFRKALDFGL